MRTIAATAIALCLLLSPGAAQDIDRAPSDDLREGADLMSDAARRLLQGLMGEAEPAMRDLAEAMRGWNLGGLALEDLDDYRAPEVLPNGDIIIRRKTPLSPLSESDEIEI